MFVPPLLSEPRCRWREFWFVVSGVCMTKCEKGRPVQLWVLIAPHIATRPLAFEARQFRPAACCDTTYGGGECPFRVECARLVLLTPAHYGSVLTGAQRAE
jgi:hypothetical protein